MKSFLALFLCIFFFSCQNSEPEAQVDQIQAISLPERKYAPSEESSAASAPAYLVEPGKADIGQKVIRDATLRFETDDMDQTYDRIGSATKKYGAQIQNDFESKEYNSVSRQLTIRIPNRHFDAFLTDVGKGVSYFDQKEITSTDVTEEYIDIDARLNAKKRLEARYLELLQKAGKVSEMLEVERQLATVREEIESKEGRLRYLKNRIDLSTVNITFYKSVATQGGAKVSYGTKLWNAVATGFNSILLFFVGVLNNWPLILILVVLFFWLFRKLRARKKP